jgi:hypothetical protein
MAQAQRLVGAHGAPAVPRRLPVGAGVLAPETDAGWRLSAESAVLLAGRSGA